AGCAARSAADGPARREAAPACGRGDPRRRGARRDRAGSLLGGVVFRVDDAPLEPAHLPLLAGEVALRLVEEPLRLPRLAGYAGDREPGALPELVVVDLRDRGAEPVLELSLRRAEVRPFPLQRPRLGEVQLERQDS